MSRTTAGQAAGWVSQRDAARIADVPLNWLRTAVKRSIVLSRQLPGGRTQVNLADVQRVVREAVRPAAAAR